MSQSLPDIPRLFTAVAEWAAYVIYIVPLKKRFQTPVIVLLLMGLLILQCALQIAAGMLPIQFWVPGMIAAVGLMFAGIFLCCETSAFDAGYCCARAFITAELAASLGWQLYCYFFLGRSGDSAVVSIAVVGITYICVFSVIYVLESKRMPYNTRLNVTAMELVSALLIAAAVFIISNVYFAVQSSIFSASTGASLFFIRTTVDFSGVTMLYAQQEQRNEIRLQREVEVLDNVLHRQYNQYKKFRGSIELLNHKYHDLKHQIAVIRAESDPVKKESYLAEMDQALKVYSTHIDTGNKVLDIVLTEKALYCTEQDITLTCVADGVLLNFMEAMDICTIFGNALDNAIESVRKLNDVEKRLIRVAVYAQNDMLMLRFENYTEEPLIFENGLPATTKQDKNYHGYGIKSILHTAEKYSGNMTIHHENNWFIMRVLIPA
jgi:hypothetical protein